MQLAQGNIVLARIDRLVKQNLYARNAHPHRSIGRLFRPGV